MTGQSPTPKQHSSKYPGIEEENEEKIHSNEWKEKDKLSKAGELS